MKSLLLSSAAILLPTIAAPVAIGQTAPVPETRKVIDERNVNLRSGTYDANEDLLSIGSGDGALPFSRHWVGGDWWNGYFGMLTEVTDPDAPNYGSVTVWLNETASHFDGTNSENNDGDGSRLSTADDVKITYTTKDGTKILYDRDVLSNGESYYGSGQAVPLSMTTGAGKKVSFFYQTGSYSYLLCYYGSSCYTMNVGLVRLRSLQSNYGYQLRFSYVTDTATEATASEWSRLSKVVAINTAVDYCDPAAASCTLASSWPEVNFSRSVTSGTGYEQATDPLGQVTRYAIDNYQLSGIRPPGASADAISYAYTSGALTSVTDNLGSWTYGASDNTTFRTTTITDPQSHATTVTVHKKKGVVTSATDALSHSWAYAYDTKGRLLSRTNPESDQNIYAYAVRDNVTTLTMKPKPGSSLADRTVTVAYPASCGNPLTCNKPASITDARGATTDFTYDASTGQALTEAGPADANGVRPVKRYQYTLRKAWLKAGGTGYVQASDGVWLLTGEKTCRTSVTSTPFGYASTCAGGAADEVTTLYDYGPDTGSSGNNLLLRGVATTADVGGTATTLRTCYGYDARGRRISETKPNANLSVCS